MSFPFARFQVEGDSMLPRFQPGQRVLIFRWGTPRIGDTIVFAKNGLTMVKCAVAKEGDRWVVGGENYSESEDSGSFGAVDNNAIVGKVIATY